MEYISSSVIGIITGILSSYLVTRYYRKLDFERQKNRYIMDMKRHLTMIIRLLSDIEIYKEASYVEQLRTELLEIPLKEKEFIFLDYELEMVEQYTKNRKEIFLDLEKYQNNKRMIENLQSTNEQSKELGIELENQEQIIRTIASRLPSWKACKHNFLDKEMQNNYNK